MKGLQREKKIGEGPDGRANSVANLVGSGDRSCGPSGMGPCVGHAIFLFPPAPLSAAPTLHQLRLLGFSFLNSSSFQVLAQKILNLTVAGQPELSIPGEGFVFFSLAS